MEDNSWPKCIMTWSQEGRRGQPKVKWENEVEMGYEAGEFNIRRCSKVVICNLFSHSIDPKIWK